MRVTDFLRRFARVCLDSWVIHQSGLFAANHYRGQYPKPGFFCRYFPLLHYVFFGAAQGKNPNPIFDTAFYLTENPDVQSANANPLAHYLRLGAYEKRPCTPWLESVLDARRNLLYFRDIIPAFNPVLFHLPTQGKAGKWYGFLPIRLKNKRLLQPLRTRARNRQTMAVVERYGANIGHNPPPFMLVAPLIRQHWPEPQTCQSTFATVLPTTYAVISAIGEDNPAHFDACAKSLEQAIAAVPNTAIEWIIVSPYAHIKNLQNQMPLSLRHLARFYPTTQKNKAEMINEAAALSSGEWLIFLDEKDQLAPDTMLALEEALRHFPHGRLMLSAMADIDEKGRILRQRPPLFAPQDFFEAGMPYKLLAIRRDLWKLLQGFDTRFTVCHDYDLTLKTILQEAVLCLPKPLYRYRMDTLQTLEENNAIDAIRQSFIQSFATRELSYNPPPPKPPFSTNPPRGICFVRTQGKRMDYLLDALLSIQHQTQPLTPCVIVHGNDEVFLQVQGFLQEHHIQAIFLHAPDVQRRRGYPLNVGIDYLALHRNDYDYLCFLDDDDIFYPNFGKRLSQVLQDSGKDVVFAQTMGKAIDGSLAPIHPPLPPICLLASNFIPINAYVVRVDFFLDANIRFPEDMDYVEDWHILLQMLAKGASFMPLFETHAEIRLIGDGNATFKNNPAHFESCYNRVRNKGRTIASAISIGQLLWDMAAFDWKKRPYPLHDYEMALLEEVFSFFRATP